jgi:DNA-binding transcriptional regulator YiaG
MKTKFEDFEVLVPKTDGSGVAEKVNVMVPVRWDEELQDWLMTPEAHEIIDHTKARLIGLLLPDQLKELRERFDFTQKEMGELFQVGEKSWTRWESGKHRPSRVINLLIRALYEGEVSINYLLERAGKHVKPESEQVAQAFLAFCKAWQTTATDWSKTVVQYHTTSTKPIQVRRKAGKGKSALIAKLLESVHVNPVVAEQLSLDEVTLSRLRYELPTPTHSYPQPRLTTPTVA